MDSIMCNLQLSYIITTDMFQPSLLLWGVHINYICKPKMWCN